MRDNSICSHLVSIRQDCGKIRKLGMRKLNLILRRVEVGDRVLAEVWCKDKCVCSLSTCKRVAGASDQYCWSLTRDKNVIASAAIQNGVMLVGAIDRHACSSAEIGLVRFGNDNRQKPN